MKIACQKISRDPCKNSGAEGSSNSLEDLGNNCISNYQGQMDVAMYFSRINDNTTSYIVLLHKGECRISTPELEYGVLHDERSNGSLLKCSLSSYAILVVHPQARVNPGGHHTSLGFPHIETYVLGPTR